MGKFERMAYKGFVMSTSCMGAVGFYPSLHSLFFAFMVFLFVSGLFDRMMVAVGMAPLFP